MRISILPLVLLFVVSLAGCGSGKDAKNNKNQFTDLSGVSIEDMQIHGSIYDVDLTKYTEDDSGKKEVNTYNYSKLKIKTDDNGSISKIEGDIQGYVNGGILTDGIGYCVNGESIFYTVDEIIEVLGGNYNDYWYDKENYLRAATFTDEKIQVELTFIYDDNSRNFARIILSDLANPHATIG